MIESSSGSAGRVRPPISVGIGSWTDKEYKGLLFPKGLPDNQRLTTYATWFDHVEVNSSYHRLPPLAFVENWVKQTPADFVFDFKLPKEISTDPEGTAKEGRFVSMLLGVARPLIEAKKLGAFFLVLPPSFGPKKRRLEELDALVEKLQPHLLAVELRHSDWVAGEQRERTLEYFRQKQLVWIAVDMPRIEGSTIMPPLDEVTNPRMAYLRLHGRRPDWLTLKGDAEEKHTYAYPDSELAEIAARVKTLASKAAVVHAVANNHAQDFAPKTALALQRLLGLAKRGPLTEAAPPAEEGLLPGF
jgi:uncharacterized protein YecE (DUF72 family)